MKLVVTYASDSDSGSIHEVFVVEKFHSEGGVLKMFKRNASFPFHCINIDELSWWRIREEEKVSSKIEQFLTDNHGKVSFFYDHVASGSTPGLAFRCALSKPHLFMLRREGLYDSLIHETDFDSPKILEIIEFLETESIKYPEDHPIWYTR